MSDLIAFLRARLDDDERSAKSAAPGPWELSDRGWQLRLTADEPGFERIATADNPSDPVWHAYDHIARHDPARVLREVEAKRQMLRTWPDPMGQWTAEQADAGRKVKEAMLRHLVLPYSDHPEFNPEWRD